MYEQKIQITTKSTTAAASSTSLKNVDEKSRQDDKTATPDSQVAANHGLLGTVHSVPKPKSMVEEASKENFMTRYNEVMTDMYTGL
jgi:hypothetical protein